MYQILVLPTVFHEDCVSVCVQCAPLVHGIATPPNPDLLHFPVSLQLKRLAIRPTLLTIEFILDTTVTLSIPLDSNVHLWLAEVRANVVNVDQWAFIEGSYRQTTDQFHIARLWDTNGIWEPVKWSGSQVHIELHNVAQIPPKIDSPDLSNAPDVVLLPFNYQNILLCLVWSWLVKTNRLSRNSF